MPIWNNPLLILSLVCLLTPSSGAVRNDPATSREIIVYSRGVTEIREIRQITVEKGRGEALLTMLPYGTDGATITLKVNKPKEISTISVSFADDLLDMDRMWERRIGEHVRLNDTLAVGTLLRVTDNKLFVAPDSSPGKIQIIDRSDVEDLTLDAMPDGLVAEPSVRWQYEAKRAQEVEVSLSYFCNDFTWTANYQALLEKDNLSLNGSYIVDNLSDLSFNYKRLTLVAGEIHLASDKRRVDRHNPKAGAASGDTQTQFGDLRRFVIDQGGILTSGQNTVLPMLTADAIPYQTRYVYDATIFDDRITTHIEFALIGKQAAPMPSGIVKVFKTEKNEALFIGEDSIDDTPSGSPLDLTLSQTFDLTAERKREREETTPDGGTRQMFKVTLGNSRDQGVTVEVLERLFGDWSIKEANIEGKPVEPIIEDARTVRFDVPVGAGKTAVLTYLIEYVR